MTYDLSANNYEVNRISPMIIAVLDMFYAEAAMADDKPVIYN